MSRSSACLQPIGDGRLVADATTKLVSFHLIRIDDPSEEITTEDIMWRKECVGQFRVGKSRPVADLKRRVAEKARVPPERHAYYLFTPNGAGSGRSGRRVFQRDGESVEDALDGRIFKPVIAVRFLPEDTGRAATAPLTTNGAAEDAGDDGKGDEPRAKRRRTGNGVARARGKDDNGSDGDGGTGGMTAKAASLMAREASRGPRGRNKIEAP